MQLHEMLAILVFCMEWSHAYIKSEQLRLLSGTCCLYPHISLSVHTYTYLYIYIYINIYINEELFIYIYIYEELFPKRWYTLIHTQARFAMPYNKFVDCVHIHEVLFPSFCELGIGIASFIGGLTRIVISKIPIYPHTHIYIYTYIYIYILCVYIHIPLTGVHLVTVIVCSYSV